MKSMSLITHPDQKFDGLGTLGSRLALPPGWRFRAPVLEQDLILTPDKDGVAHITRTTSATPTIARAVPTATSSHDTWLSIDERQLRFTRNPRHEQ